MCLHWGSRHSSNCRVGEKNSDNGFNFEYYTCLLTRPRAIRGLLWFPYGPLKYWFEIDCQIFLQKGVLFRISKELQSGDYNGGEQHAGPCTARLGEHFMEGEGGWEGCRVKSPRLFIESLPGKQMSCSCSCWVLLWLLGCGSSCVWSFSSV